VAGGGAWVAAGAGGWVVTGCAVAGGCVAAGAAAVGVGRLALGAADVEVVVSGITMLSISERAPEGPNGLAAGGGCPVVVGAVGVVVAVDVVVAGAGAMPEAGVAAVFVINKEVGIAAARVDAVWSLTVASSAAVMFALAAIAPAMPTVATALVTPTARRARLAGWGLEVSCRRFILVPIGPLRPAT